MVQLTHISVAQFRERELIGSFLKSQSGLTGFMCSNHKRIQSMVKKPLNGANHGKFLTFVHPILHFDFDLNKLSLVSWLGLIICRFHLREIIDFELDV